MKKARVAKQKAQQAKAQLSRTSPAARRTAVSSSLQGAGPSLSRPEFENIMRTTGVSAEKLLERAGSRGVGLNAGVVNALNRGKLGAGADSFATYRGFTQAGAGPVSRFPYSLAGMAKESKGFIQGLQGLNLSRGQRYMGSYEADGKRVPVIQTRSAIRGGAGIGRGTTTEIAGAGTTSGQTDYGIRPMSDEERRILTASGSTPRWIPGLNAPGTDNYDPEYGGGGWVSTTGIPGGTGPSGAATDEFMKAYSKATTLARQLGQMGAGGSVESVYEMAKRFDEQQAQKPAAAGLTGYSQPIQSGTAGEAAATSGGKVQKLRNKIQKTKALIKSSKSELAARGF